ncbi:hypothetical protein [Paramaledivibacter caminithermalis]|jgi:ribosomal protein L29|uniref:Uncharacterized protein n=1 Tax=Paramaledivibacter caminithermalis (strain DSM 15212 / CIP 107654 / DViRD3) TaxID=1121301 RepID=A0A1M6PLS5_PARC5|nr:hypothetical protein [Paramaledivibacter caminithermalis]SHK08885.1 hypothetical protein SAMN02745912_02203 [Paramaledivibacter caminithermalis DSM 15212]
MRKKLCLILSVVLIFSLVNISFATSNLKFDKIRLQNLGYDEKEIKNMSKEEYNETLDMGKIISHNERYFKMVKRVNNIKDSEFLLSTIDNNDTKIIELTKEQFEQEVGNFKNNNKVTIFGTIDSDTATSSFVKLKTYVYDKITSGSHKGQHKIKHYFRLYTNEANNENIFGVSLSTTLLATGGEKFYLYWDKVDLDTGKTIERDYKKYTRAQHRGAEGYAFEFDLDDGYYIGRELYGRRDFSGSMYMYVESNNSSNTLFGAYGDFAMKKTFRTVNPYVSFKGDAGLGISPSSKYLEADNTEVIWRY